MENGTEEEEEENKGDAKERGVEGMILLSWSGCEEDDAGCSNLGGGVGGM